MKWLNWKEIIDKYNLFDWITENKQKEWMIYDLYYEIWFITLNDFMASLITDALYNEFDWNQDRELDFTLNFILPLLKEWKIKVRLRSFKFDKNINWAIHYKLEESKEYKMDEASQAIKDILSSWSKLKTIKERRNFTMDSVQFALTENDWIN